MNSLESHNLSPITIQLAVDGSEHSIAATHLIRDLLLPRGSQVTALGVLPSRRSPDRVALMAALEDVKMHLQAKGIQVFTSLLHGRPSSALIDFANEHRPDLMVVGATGLRATMGILLSGVAQQVVEHARWPVLVVRSPYEGLRRVLLVTDGSANSQRAVDYIVQIPLPRNIQLHAMNVLPPLGTPETPIPARMAPMITVPTVFSHQGDPAATRQAEAEEHQGRMLLTQTADALKAGQFEVVPVLRRGDAATEILEHAKAHKVNLVVTGSRDFSAVKGWLVGSVSRKLIYQCKCSVLLIPAQMEV
ncbi:MAG TPA: universal stress protein [Anaerolineales bacterium]|nr:universal stress protein [Anaerolineales bacterium]